MKGSGSGGASWRDKWSGWGCTVCRSFSPFLSSSSSSSSPSLPPHWAASCLSSSIAPAAAYPLQASPGSACTPSFCCFPTTSVSTAPPLRCPSRRCPARLCRRRTWRGGLWVNKREVLWRGGGEVSQVSPPFSSPHRPRCRTTAEPAQEFVLRSASCSRRSDTPPPLPPPPASLLPPHWSAPEGRG